MLINNTWSAALLSYYTSTQKDSFSEFSLSHDAVFCAFLGHEIPYLCGRMVFHPYVSLHEALMQSSVYLVLAIRAGIRLISCMESHMSSKARQVPKLVATYVTFEWHLAFVSPEMLSQVSACPESFVTLRTCKWLDFRMSLLMAAQAQCP